MGQANWKWSVGGSGSWASGQYMNTISQVLLGGNFPPPCPYARYDPEYEQVNECIQGATVLAKWHAEGKY